MGRLTYETEAGEWGLVRYDIKKVPKELYGAVCKLHEYEKSGLDPEEMRKVNDFSESQVALYLEKYQAYARLGVTPEQLLIIDDLYAERCKEIHELQQKLKETELAADVPVSGRKKTAQWKKNLADRFLRVE